MQHTYRLTLDTESEALAQRWLEHMRLGREHLSGLILDAVMTGLFSKWLDAEQTTSCLDGVRAEVRREDVAPGETVTALRLMPRAKGDGAPPAAREAGEALAKELGVPVERVFLAAARVGLLKLRPVEAPKRGPDGPERRAAHEAMREAGRIAQAAGGVAAPLGVRLPRPGSYVPPSVVVELGGQYDESGIARHKGEK